MGAAGWRAYFLLEGHRSESAEAILSARHSTAKMNRATSGEIVKKNEAIKIFTAMLTNYPIDLLSMSVNQ